jgi:hypothetical protein
MFIATFIDALWVVLVYGFVFGVAALSAWVGRYWLVVLPRRDPRLARAAAAQQQSVRRQETSSQSAPPQSRPAHLGP